MTGRAILIVEDNTDISDTLLAALEDRGEEAQVAWNGAEALARLDQAEELPRLILLDLMMPVMDGWEFREAQRNAPKLAGIPVVVMSAHVDVQRIAEQLGAVAWLKKPFEIDELMRVVARDRDAHAHDRPKAQTPLLSHTEYRLLVEHSPVMVWRAGLDAKCDYFNDTWLAFTGRTMAEEQGDGWAEGVHKDDLAPCVEHYLSHFRRREAFEMEYRLRRHDGVYRWIFDRGVPFCNDNGEFAGFIGSCVDVEDRRRAQAARERQNEEQLAFAREFEQWILAIVSHDIRNPLGAINGSANILALRAENDPAVRALAERINRSSNRIARIVADLLDVSRERHGGGIPIVLAAANIHDICRDVADEIATAASDRTISVRCQGEADGMWDSQRIAQAISNLIGNAVQHSPASSAILVDIRAENGRAVVDVRNEGAIPKELLPTIFAPFGAGATVRRRGQGLGLGLFIAQAIVQAHHGSIEVRSDVENGTTFRVSLPRLPAIAAPNTNELVQHSPFKCAPS